MEEELEVFRLELLALLDVLRTELLTKISDTRQELLDEIRELRIFLLNTVDEVKAFLLSEVTALRLYTMQELAALRYELYTVTNALETSINTKLALQKQELLDAIATMRAAIQARYDHKIARVEVNMRYLWLLISAGNTPVSSGLIGFHTFRVKGINITAYNYMGAEGEPPLSIPFNTVLVNGINIVSSMTEPFKTIKVNNVLIQAS